MTAPLADDQVPDEVAAEDVEAGATGEYVETGDERVDGALAQLAAVADEPPAAQVGAYEAAHRTLQDTLATVEES